MNTSYLRCVPSWTGSWKSWPWKLSNKWYLHKNSADTIITADKNSKIRTKKVLIVQHLVVWRSVLVLRQCENLQELLSVQDLWYNSHLLFRFRPLQITQCWCMWYLVYFLAIFLAIFQILEIDFLKFCLKILGNFDPWKRSSICCL